MAYDRDELEKLAVEAIKKHKLYFFSDVIAYLPCSMATFYNHKMEDLESIKEALEVNKVNTKVNLRTKWEQSDNPTVQIALYKLIGTEEEGDRINSQKTKVEGGQSITLNYPKEFDNP